MENLTREQVIENWLVKEQLEKGKTIDEIVAQVNEKYGGWPYTLRKHINPKEVPDKRKRKLLRHLVNWKIKSLQEPLDNTILDEIWQLKYYISALDDMRKEEREEM